MAAADNNYKCTSSMFHQKIRIGDYYNNANVLITGATGFVGKALLEKLLRSCKGVNQIYLLMRTKKGMNVNDRLTQLFESAVRVYY